MITPADIENKVFSKAVRGYKEEEVDDTILKAVKLQMMYEYKSIVNPAGMKSMLIDKEEESKENSEEEEDKDSKENESDEDSKENKCNSEEEKEEEEKKENSKFFSFLHNAKSNHENKKAIETMASGLARGKARYGSK